MTTAALPHPRRRPTTRLTFYRFASRGEADDRRSEGALDAAAAAKAARRLAHVALEGAAERELRVVADLRRDGGQQPGLVG